LINRIGRGSGRDYWAAISIMWVISDTAP